MRIARSARLAATVASKTAAGAVHSVYGSNIARRSLATEATSTADQASVPSQLKIEIPAASSGHAAYAEALKYIAADRDAKLARIAELQRQHPSPAPELAEEIEQLSIAAHQSDPETVELYRAGQVDFNQPTHRHWAKLEWLLARRRTLVGRMIQSGIIPDLIPKSTVHKMRMEVDIAFPQSARKTLLAPGMFVECRLTNKAPVIQAAIMHKEKLKYTIVVSDLDDPDHVTRSYRERCHLLMTNVELSRNEPLVDLSKESVETVLSYIPPHPAEGTKQHRYAVAFYLQPENGTKSVSISEPSISSEDGRIIDSAALATKHELDLVGATYFTTMYDSSVDAVRAKYSIQTPAVYEPVEKENIPDRHIPRTRYSLV